MGLNVYRKWSLFLAWLIVGAGCTREQQPPKVLGIPFAVPIAAIKQHLPEGAKPEQYPLIPLYGYKLQLANPENWEVLVQEEAPKDLAENSIFLIYTTRSLDKSCSRAETKALIETLREKYSPGFAASYVTELPNEDAYSFVATAERRMLTISARCFVRSINAGFTYFDLDRYQYRKPDQIESLISKGAQEAKGYASRTFK